MKRGRGPERTGWQVETETLTLRGEEDELKGSDDRMRDSWQWKRRPDRLERRENG